MFSQNNLSKDDLIASLNVFTLKLNNKINVLNSKELKDSLKYLLTTSSTDDPYQIANLVKVIDEELEDLKQQLTTKKYLASVFSVTSILSFFFSVKNSNEGYGASPTTVATPIACIATPLSFYELYSIKNITQEITKLNRMKKLIEDYRPLNEKLSHLLVNDSIKTLRAEFYQIHILEKNLLEQKEKQNKDKMKGSLVRWNLSKSFLPDIAFGKLPEKLPEFKISR